MYPMAENDRQADFYDAPEEEQSHIRNVETGFKDESQVIKRETSEKAKRILAAPEGREIRQILKSLPEGLIFAEGEAGLELDEIKRRISSLMRAENDNDLPFRVDKGVLRRLYFLIEIAERRTEESAEN